jgi:hypothetical protein
VGDVMLGHNSIVVNTRDERYVLANGRYLVDIINPATRTVIRGFSRLQIAAHGGILLGNPTHRRFHHARLD